MKNRFEIDPENGWVDTAVENAARAMCEDEWGSWDETLESVRSIYRNRASAVAAAGLLRTEPAVHPADVPQPGDRVRVTWRRTGNTREFVVDEHGYYEGKGAVLMYPDTVTVEVIEPAPPPCSECTGTAGWPNPDCPVHGVVARVREEMAARSSSTNRPSSSTTPESGGTEEHGEPAPATEQPSESSEQRAKRVFVNRLKAAAVKCCKAGREAYPDPCPWHPADTGKEAGRG